MIGRAGLTQLFASRAKFGVRTVDDFDTTDWIEWESLTRFAPVDYNTLTPDQKDYYAPDQLSPGSVFLAPDNEFWRDFEKQGMIKRVKK